MLESQGREMNNHLRDVELLRAWNRKVVIPIVGKALSFLFGRVSEEEVRIVRCDVA